MDKYILILVLSLVVNYEVNGRSWGNNYFEGSSFGDRGVIFKASDVNPEVRRLNGESHRFGYKQLLNWDPDKIWFPDFDDKQPSIGTTSTKPTEVVATSINECIKQCPKTSEYNPVCGTDRVTYSNVGKLECARSCGVGVVLLKKLPCSLVFQESSTNKVTETLEDEQRQCIKSCPTTPEYNPICGTNGVTYKNIGTLECAKYCGVVVDVRRLSPCPRTIRTSTESLDEWATSTRNYVTSSTVAPDKSDVINEIFNSPTADSIEDDIDIRLGE